uniref:Cadherin-like domain-containing protein n=1 Tax=Panagrellus redivivus TaxID=6233 RepID=A0A7E4VM94_PANRE
MRRRYGLLTAAFIAVVAVVYAETVLEYVRVPPTTDIEITKTTLKIQPNEASTRFGISNGGFTILTLQPPKDLTITVFDGKLSHEFRLVIGTSRNSYTITYNNIARPIFPYGISNMGITFSVDDFGKVTLVANTHTEVVATITGFAKKVVSMDAITEYQVFNNEKTVALIDIVTPYFYVGEIRTVTPSPTPPTPPPPPPSTSQPTEEVPEAEDDDETTEASKKKKPAVPYAIIGVVIGGVLLSLITLGIGVFVGRKCTKGPPKEDEEESNKTEKKDSTKQEKSSENSGKTKKSKKSKGDKKKPSKAATPTTGVEKLKAKRAAEIEARKNKQNPPPAVKPADNSVMLHRTNLDSNQTWMKDE